MIEIGGNLLREFFSFFKSLSINSIYWFYLFYIWL